MPFCLRITFKHWLSCEVEDSEASCQQLSISLKIFKMAFTAKNAEISLMDKLLRVSIENCKIKVLILVIFLIFKRF